MMAQPNNGKIQLRLTINLRLHQLICLLFLVLVSALALGHTSPYPLSLRPYITFVFLFP